LHLLNNNYASIEENDTGLKAPSNNLINIINNVLNIFETNYKYFLKKRKLNFN